MGTATTETIQPSRPAMVSERIAASVAQHQKLAKLTVSQYHQMIKQGILKEGAPIELLHGVLVLKNRARLGGDPLSIYPPHSTAVLLIGKLDRQLDAFGCHLRSQQPVSLYESHEPEPDGAIVKGAIEDYGRRHPVPGEIYSVLEAADSSLDGDRTEKLEAYANAGIPQYIIVNLIDKQLEVYEGPVPAENRYATKTILRPGQKFQLFVGPEARLEALVEKLLP